MEVDGNLFDEFPPEINVWIESFFDKECRLRARVICKKWFKLYNTSHFDIYIPEAPQIRGVIETFSRCGQPFSLKFHKADKLSNNIGNKAEFTRLTNLTCLEVSMASKRKQFAAFDLDLPNQIQRVEGPIGIELSPLLTNLKHIDVGSIKSKTTTGPYLPNLEFLATTFRPIPELDGSKLTTLILKSATINLTVQKKLNEFTNLKVLKLLGTCSFTRDLTLKMPNLEELEVFSPPELNVICDSTKLTWLRTQALVPGLIRHSTLKSLTIKPFMRMEDDNFVTLKSFPNLEEINIEHQIQENIRLNGTIFQFMNPDTLNRLSISLESANIDKIASFTNICELNLVLQKPVTDIDILSELSNLTRLAIGGIKTPQLDWLNTLTKLKELFVDFKSSQNLNEVPLDLSDLTNLRTLVITPRTNKIISSLKKLTRLERLEFPMTNENIFHDQWLYLTSLTYYQAADNEQVSKLTRLRELDCIVVTNNEIAQLTSLQKLTRFICRSTTASSMFLTLLTRLQSVAFSNKISPADWSSVQPWSYYNAYPDVVRNLPNFIPGPKDADTLTYCFTLLNHQQ